MRGNTEQSNRIFIKMVNGKFAESVSSNTPNAVKRYSENKKQDVYERLDSFIEGRITQIKLEKGTYGWEMILLVRDIDELYQIQIQTSSGHFTSFANKLPNINLNQDVHLEPYAFDDKEKKKKNGDPKRVVGMTVRQGSEKIPNVYSKDNPIPELSYPRDGDEEDVKMYYMQEEKFFRSLVQKFAGQFATEQDVKSELGGATTNGAIPPNKEAKREFVKLEDMPEDDLPF